MSPLIWVVVLLLLFTKFTKKTWNDELEFLEQCLCFGITWQSNSNSSLINCATIIIIWSSWNISWLNLGCVGRKKTQLFKLFLGVYIFVPTSVIQRCGFATAVLVNFSTRVGTEQWAVCTHWPSHHFWMPLQYTYVTITSKVAKKFLSNLLHCALSCTVYCNRPCLFVCLWVPYYSQRAVFASPLSAFGVRSSGRQTNWATDNWATI